MRLRQVYAWLEGQRPYRAQDDDASPSRHYEERSFVIIQCLVSEFIGLDTVVKPR